MTKSGASAARAPAPLFFACCPVRSLKKIMAEPYAVRRDPMTGKIVERYRNRAEYIAGRRRATDAARQRRQRLERKIRRAMAA